MRIYTVGEDVVTCAIIKRILLHCSKDFEVISELPARGGQIKKQINEFNKLAETFPVVLLTDLDSSTCAPQLLKDLIPTTKHRQFILNIAIDEGEAWLMADREGFAEFAGVEIEKIPKASLQKQGGRKGLLEMEFSYKSSWFLTHELLKNSKKLELVKQLTAKEGATKGPEYNTGILPFIEKKWDIDAACKNSDSLNRMVNRIKNLISS
jgi:hypothetical protein